MNIEKILTILASTLLATLIVTQVLTTLSTLETNASIREKMRSEIELYKYAILSNNTTE